MPRMRGRSALRAAREQAVRNEARRVNRNFESFTEDFENTMRGLFLVNCSKCYKRGERAKFNRQLCDSCRKTGFNLFTAENGMDVGPVPDELQDLSMIEEILIARIHPVVSAFRIRGQQMAYSGHVMNFAQRVERLATTLPHSLGDIDSVVILNRQTPVGIAQFRVRAQRVRRALIWLKANNMYYNDIVIDEERVHDLPDDGDVSGRVRRFAPDDEDELDQVIGDAENADNLISRSAFPNIPAINEAEAILRHAQPNQQPEMDWPDVDNTPINEFSTEGYICMAFPSLFPYGRGDLNAPRIEKVKPHEYFKYLMSYKDGRFAKDIRFPYFAFNSVSRRDAIRLGNIYVQQNEFGNLTAEDIREMARSEDDGTAASIMYYGATLRGTRSYWQKRSSELCQMVRQIGCPTVFFTLSAADYHWPDLFRLLVPDRDPLTISDVERRRLMHENPMLTAWYFKKRVEVFIKSFMMKLFSIDDYWYRFEWQHRGSPHIHGLLWLKDAPDCSDIDSLSEEEQQEIIDFFDALVSANIGQVRDMRFAENPCRRRFTDLSAEQKEHDLDRLLSAVQRHTKCSASCMRKNRGTSRMECRFKFPQPLEEEPSLRKEDGVWKFFPARNDPLLQRYNKFITQVWRANTDFSPITSKDAVISYIAKYTSKAEFASEDYSTILRRIMRRNTDDTPAATLVRQLLISSVAERNFSAQEVAHLLMGWPLYRSSRSVFVLSLKDDWARWGADPDNQFVKRYSSRSPEMSHYPLFQFAKIFRYEGQRLVRRQKDCIVRTVPFIKMPENPDPNHLYWQHQCKLYVPWSGQFEALKPNNMTWEELYLSRGAQFNANEDIEIPDNLDDEFEPADLDDQGIIRDAGLAAARMAPDQSLREPLGQRIIDEAYVWPDTQTENLSQSDVNSYLSRLSSMSQAESNCEQPIFTLNPEQQQIMGIAKRQLLDPSMDIKRVIVQGKAGTGKSVIIRSICAKLDACSPNHKLYRVLAPTGAAAVNVNGQTLHSALRIPARDRINPLTGYSLRKFQLEFKHVKFVIIDEYSMIGLRLLHKIHLRLQEAKASVEPFGGLFIFLFGDLRQIPPVLDTAIYMSPRDDFSQYAIGLVNSFQKKFVLTVSQRQTSDQASFKRALDEIAIGKLSQAGWQLLMTRRVTLFQTTRPEFKDAVRLFPKNSEVYEHNRSVLDLIDGPGGVLEAEHNNETARLADSQVASGLSPTLALALGCRVMLRRNLFVNLGLVNGSIGTVKKMVFRPGQRPPALPVVIFIEFDNFKGPFFDQSSRTFPLLPMMTNWNSGSVECSRRQFPLSVAYALTVHKAQGLTLAKTIVDIGDKDQCTGLSYVALSRVRKLDDMLLAKGYDFGRFSSMQNSRSLIARENFMRAMGIS